MSEHVALRDGRQVLIRRLTPADGPGLLAAFVRLSEESRTQRFLSPKSHLTSEVAVTVGDDWQGRGLGTELLQRVSARARQGGIQRFTALVASDNAAMIELLRGIGAGIHADGAGGGALAYEIEIEPAGMGEKLRAALRAAAAGHLAPPARVRQALAALLPERT